MKACCTKEARRSLSKHRDVATCDECGSLLLAYENDRDFESTKEELERHGATYEAAEVGKLKVIAKRRRPSRS